MPSILEFNYAGLTPTVFQGASAFFDPRINKAFQLGRDGKISIGNFHAALKALYTRNNIRNYFCAFWGSYAGGSPHSHILPLIDQIPENQLWALAFIDIRGADSQRVSYRYFTYEARSLPRMVENSSGRNVYLVQSTNSSRTELWSRFLQDIEKVANDYNGAFESVPADTLIDIESSGWYNVSFLISFRRFITDSAMYYNEEEDDSIRPSSLMAESNCKIVLNFSDDMVAIGHSMSFRIILASSMDNRKRLYKTMNYSADPLQYISWPKVEAHEKNPVLYGVELEVSYGCDLQKLIDSQEELFFMVKSDGSIRGNKKNLGEIVTVPMSLKAHKKHWASWFSKMDYNDFDITKNTTNGMHVHIDRKAFMNNHHLNNMVFFYNQPANRDFISYVSERDGKTEYCQPVNFSANHTKVSAYKSITQLAGGEKYRLVNLNKKATVEVRIFKGIVSFAEVVKNLEFVDAVFHFCEGERSVTKLTMVDFIQWLNTEVPKNKYQTLRVFLSKIKNLDRMIMKSELYNILFAQNKDDKIVDILNKSSLRLTQGHVSILNRDGKGVRRFMLNKDTGKLQIWMKPGSRIADLDRSLEQKFLFKKPAPTATVATV